jgi:hypothetical protein
MNGDVKRAGAVAIQMAVALCWLAGCNAGSGGATSAASSGAASSTLLEAVRAATDRSGAQRSTVTLPSGERLQRMSFPQGYSHVVIAKRGPDGRPSVSCVDSAPAAESFLAGGDQGNAQ